LSGLRGRGKPDNQPGLWEAFTMWRMKRTGWTLIVTFVVILAAQLTTAEPPGRSFCSVPAYGAGTGEVPPVGCSYISPDEFFTISAGMPAGTTIEADPILHSFVCHTTPCETAGGSLGGTTATFDSTLTLFMKGTGILTGFVRQIDMPMVSEVHTAPRTPGDRVQSFTTDYFSLHGTIAGDPDFGTLTINAGWAYGIPSPGKMTLTKRLGDSFSVDSFFDIVYWIDYDGATGGALDGLSGLGGGMLRMAVEAPPRPMGACVVADDGSGTAELPPSPCEYLSVDEFFVIRDGLPVGTTVELHPTQGEFVCVNTPCGQPGGSLGGEYEEFDSTLTLQVTGTGTLAGFNRTLMLPAPEETHSGPRTPGDPLQHFGTEIWDLSVTLVGDPDFSSLSITAGSGSGLPSPGMTTLTRQPDGNFVADSFFDISYLIDFVGAPGSALDGKSGINLGSVSVIAGTKDIFADGFESGDTSVWSSGVP
jgi:hypothetical protein